MLRMEIALFLVIIFLAYAYFSAEEKGTFLHKLFSVILIVMLVHLVLDGVTIYTVNHMDISVRWDAGSRIYRSDMKKEG